MSLPSRECGLKLADYVHMDDRDFVTPLAGVWVEIWKNIRKDIPSGVTPLAGVWVEIIGEQIEKYKSPVTPLAGVWVEIGRRWKGVRSG